MEITSSSETRVDTVTVQFAYEVRRGNAFQHYDPLDFDLSHPSMQIEAEGANIDHREKNILRFTIIEKNFSVRVTGFDALRDVVMKMNWTP